MLPTFLRTRVEAIVQRWLPLVRALPAAAELSEAAIIDNLPAMLEQLACTVDGDPAAEVALGAVIGVHVEGRAQAGFSLADVIAEYGMLRQAVFDEFVETAVSSTPAEARIAELTAFNRTVDAGIAEAVEHYNWRRKAQQDRLIGILAHDMRSPLQVIALSAQVLLRQQLSDDGRGTAGRIVASAAKLDQLTTDLLDFARTRMGGSLPVMPAPADLREVLLRAYDEARLLHPQRDLRHAADQAPEAPCRIDAARMGQALTNLLSNAIRHGGDPIIVRLDTAEERIVVSVCNRGRIDDAVRQTLFQPFETSDPQRGTGLGLYIVCEIARAHGGGVEVEAGDDDTTFRLHVPRAAA